LQGNYYIKNDLTSLMGRILAIDYGGKRTGLAWTDPLQISINPLDTIDTGSFEDWMTKLLSEQSDLSTVVFGLPTHSDGTLTKIGEKVIKYKNTFEAKFSHVTWEVIDESFSSKEARRLMVHLGVKKKKREQKSNLDKMSAVLILKSYLDSI